MTQISVVYNKKRCLRDYTKVYDIAICTEGEPPQFIVEVDTPDLRSVHRRRARSAPVGREVQDCVSVVLLECICVDCCHSGSSILGAILRQMCTACGPRSLDMQAPKQTPKRGDWCQTSAITRSHGRIVCKEYTAPPPLGECVGILPYSHWFGPVHEVIEFGRFVSVSVPSWHQPGMLVWVNIENCGTRFACLDRRGGGFLD